MSYQKTARTKIGLWIAHSDSGNITEVAKDIRALRTNNMTSDAFAKKYQEFDRTCKNYKTLSSLEATIRRTYNTLKRSNFKNFRKRAKELKDAYLLVTGPQPPPPPPPSFNLIVALASCLPLGLKQYRSSTFANGIWVDQIYEEKFKTNDKKNRKKKKQSKFPLLTLWAENIEETITNNVVIPLKLINKAGILIGLYRVSIKYQYSDSKGNVQEAYISTKAVNLNKLSDEIIKRIKSLINLDNHENFDVDERITSEKINSIEADSGKILKTLLVKLDCYIHNKIVNQIKVGMRI